MCCSSKGTQQRHAAEKAGEHRKASAGTHLPSLNLFLHNNYCRQDGSMDSDFKMLTPEELITHDPDQLRQLVQERREEDKSGNGAGGVAGGATRCQATDKRRERMGNRAGGKEQKVGGHTGKHRQTHTHTHAYNCNCTCAWACCLDP